MRVSSRRLALGRGDDDHVKSAEAMIEGADGQAEVGRAEASGWAGKENG